MIKFFLFLLFAISCLTLIYGDIPWDVVWKEALQRIKGESINWNPLLDERIPRLIIIICTGASLAVSGMVMQALFQNPLASPSVLGISCGGCLAATLIFIWQWQLDFPFSVPLAAFVGCLLTLIIVYNFSKLNGNIHLETLILTGIAASTLLLAIQGALIYALRDQWHLMQLLTEWMAGSTADRTWKHVHMQLPLTLIGLTLCCRYRREIPILSLGEEEALNMGVEVKKLRWRLFLSVALLTGGAIAALGMIAFFGLVLPHIVRKIAKGHGDPVIPLCILTGGLILAGVDLALRFFDLHSLSIGNVSALIGGTFFLYLIMQKKMENLIHA